LMFIFHSKKEMMRWGEGKERKKKGMKKVLPYFRHQKRTNWCE